ncbi:helix-turn-helix transcriptional regulator [Streptacidiphilus sp. MAP5-3]|jgi:DNA-binding CsgD family transcriptional regulator|uniref:helix-turn-helix domain-containing protein n=1 Tax=unclassified Streptacidiphilus TaxID=2643834 RepID=UPI00351589CE
MTQPPTPAAPDGPRLGLVRIAITSPDILAEIRQVFAGKNLDVEFVRMPYVEVAVRPAAGAVALRPPAAAPAVPVAPAALPAARINPRRLCAEYRLNVIPVADRGMGEPAAPGGTAPGYAPASQTPHRPTVPLSQRQHEVMALVSRGVRNAEIAARLRLSEKTVKNHINRIFRSLGADSRIEAVLIWQAQQRDARAGRVPGSGGAPGIPGAATPRPPDGLRVPGQRTPTGQHPVLAGTR